MRPSGAWFFLLVAAVAVGLIVLAFRPWQEDEEPEVPVALEDAEDAVSFDLEERNSSGQFGFVTLSPQAGGVLVGVELGAPPEVAQPAGFYRGSCENLGEQAYELEPLEPPDEAGQPAEATTQLGAPLEELLGRDLVVAVLQSFDDLDTVVACSAVP